MRARFLASLLAPLAVVAACVSPQVNFTPYQNPYFPKEEFERQLNAWKAGQGVSWQLTYRGSAFADAELVINSEGPSSLGHQLPAGSQGTRTFTPQRAELAAVVDKLVGSQVFALYDGHYGAWTQGGGVGGPDVRIRVAGMEKRVSRDPGLSPYVSWEASAIQGVSDAVVELARKYVK